MTYALRTIACPDCHSNDPYEFCDTCLGSRRVLLTEREKPGTICDPNVWKILAAIIVGALLFGAAMCVRAF